MNIENFKLRARAVEADEDVHFALLMFGAAVAVIFVVLLRILL